MERAFKRLIWRYTQPDPATEEHGKVEADVQE